MYHSIADETEMRSDSDCKMKDDSMDVNFSALDTNSSTVDFHLAPSHKRRRIRRKRSSKQGAKSMDENFDQSQNDKFNKPKIVNSCILPSSTHIRFDNLADNSEGMRNELPSSTNENKTNSVNAVLPSLKTAKHARLASLLQLKNCSSPITFAPNKPKHANGTETLIDNEKPVENIDLKDKYSSLKPEEYPTLLAATEIGDIIAFKVIFS